MTSDDAVTVPDTHCRADVVCFGMLTSALVITVDELPARNTGALIKETCEFIGEDAANIACILSRWGVPTGHIGSTLGDDQRGHLLDKRRQEHGVLGTARFSQDLRTPHEINISDPSGARTFFWQRDPQTLRSLETADLSLLEGARLLYVDWYDGESLTRVMDRAIELGVPIFLNLEHGHEDASLLERYAPRTTICQVVTDEKQSGDIDPSAVARKLIDSGVETVLVTLAQEGCLGMRHGEEVRAWAPEVKVVDCCCAGAVFSAGFIYGYLTNWNLLRSLQFATTAASQSCARCGPQVSSVSEIEALTQGTKVESVSG